MTTAGGPRPSSRARRRQPCGELAPSAVDGKTVSVSDDVQRPILYLVVDSPHVLADDPRDDELHTPDEPDEDHHRCPARDDEDSSELRTNRRQPEQDRQNR